MPDTPDTPETPPPDAPSSHRSWVRPVVVVASCLVIGFVAGWVLRGDEGPVTVLAPSTETSGTATDEAAEADGGGGGNGGGATTEEEPEPPPAREEVSLAVLNGTDETGLAGRTAEEAESLGYGGVEVGNAPTSEEPSVVYHRDGGRPAAERVARDLEVEDVRALPGSGPVADAAPDGAQVILVLGPG